MKTNLQFHKWLTLTVFLIALAGTAGSSYAMSIASVASGDWENTATWDCGCVPGAGDNVTISASTVVKLNAIHSTGDVTVNGTLDTNNQFFEFEGTTFANNGAITSSTGSFGEIDFVGVGDVASTTQTISGTGSYSGGPSFPVEIHVNNNATLTPASGTDINGVRNLEITNGATLSLGQTLIFQNGTLNGDGGSTISGANGLQTKSTTALSFSGTTSAPLEIVNGTTSCAGNFGQITIDSGATLFQTATVNAKGNVTVTGTLDTHNQFFEFEGMTFANNGAITSSTGSFGEIDFVGVGDAASTTQTISGTGSYSGGPSFPVEIHVNNNAILTPASGTDINGVRNLEITNGATLSLGQTLIFQNGTLNGDGGSTISGANGLQTESTTALSFSGTTTAPLKIVNGTTSCTGNFGLITIDSGATLFQTATVNAKGNVTVTGTLDTQNQFFEFEGTTFANNGAITSSTGSFGEIDFVGVGDVASTAQTISGTGSYSGGPSFPVEIHVNNNAILAPASGTDINGVRNLEITNGATLSLGQTLIFQNGTLNGDGGSTISGANRLQTKNTTTLSFSGTTTALVEIVNGTTTSTGIFGPVTVDDGATLFQSATCTFDGNLTVNGTMDMNNQFAVFQGSTFTNDGAMISSTPYGIFEFNGLAGASATSQNVAGTGTYNTNGRIDLSTLNNTTVSAANGTIIEGVFNNTISAGSTFSNDGTLAPGFPPGQANYSGNLQLGSTSDLSFDIGGLTQGTQYDFFNKSDGAAQVLGGNLAITLINGFMPANSDTFTVLTTSTALQGAFSNVASGSRLETQDGTGSFRVTYSGNNNVVLDQFQTSVVTPQFVQLSTLAEVTKKVKSIAATFTITGSSSKSVLIIGRGLSLKSLPSLADPNLVLTSSSGSIVASNNNWKDTQENAIEATGDAPTNDQEAAILVTLAPGTYTATESSAHQGLGFGQIVVLDEDNATSSKFISLSGLGPVGPGPEYVTDGFTIATKTAQPTTAPAAVAPSGKTRVLIRVLGPSIFGLKDPTLQLVNANGSTIYTNDNWKDTQAAQIQATGLAPSNTKESAIVIDLDPGTYFAAARGKKGQGLVRVEVYEIDQTGTGAVQK